MDRRTFLKTSALAGPVLWLPRTGQAQIVPILIGGGIIIAAGGLFIGWKLWKMAREKLYEPPPMPPDGATNNPPTMPPHTNTPPRHPTRSLRAGDGQPISVSAELDIDKSGLIEDISDQGLLLADGQLALYYSEVEFERSADLETWEHQVSLRVWAGARAAVVLLDTDCQWCPDRENIWLDFSSQSPGMHFRTRSLNVY